MDRTERLLDLVATLLNAPAPIPFSQIQTLFPDYQAPRGAGLRKFERDKSELEELGLPVELFAADGEQPAGYLIDRRSYYVPDLDLRADEWALLYAAGGAALARGDFPGSRDLFYALRKIGFTQVTAPLPQFADALAFTGESADGRAVLREALAVLWTAVLHRKRVAFDYRSAQGALSERTIDPYGIAFRRGQWIAVGRDHARQALRTFRADRMRSVRLVAPRPKAPEFPAPRGFHMDEHVQQQTWEICMHEPEEVVLELDPSLLPLAGRLFPRATPANGGTRLTVVVRNRDGLLRQTLALGHRARIVSPPSARRRAIALLRALYRDLERGVAKP
jgi:predicted DNA-binding transcriptional regulator YafY